jgi:hypothetical protein
MKGHLSSQEIEGWIIGERTWEVETHVRACETCSARVRDFEGPLELFGGTVRNWATQVDRMPVAAHFQRPPWVGLRWGLALTALAIMIAAPVYQEESAKRRAAAAAAVAQDELLLREVQMGISRSVPAPMEPLAKLMWNQ